MSRPFLLSMHLLFVFWMIVIGFWLIGLLYELPFRFWWYDVVAHFFGGVWVAIALSIGLRATHTTIAGSSRGIVFFVGFFGVVALVGVWWEFGEFVADRYIFHTGFTYLNGVFEDTLSDLFFDMLGGATGFFFYRRFLKVLYA